MTQNFSLWPNPADRQIHIVTDEIIDWVEVTNIYGKQLLLLPETTTLDSTVLENGRYTVRVTTGNRVTMRKNITVSHK